MAVFEITRVALSERDSLMLERLTVAIERLAEALCPPPPDTSVEVEGVDDWQPEPEVDESAQLDENMSYEQVLALAREDAKRAARQARAQNNGHDDGDSDE